MLKNVTIDFWNTLFDSSGGIERNALRQKALVMEIDKFGVVVKRDEFDAAMQASWGFFSDIWTREQRTPAPRETVAFFWNYLKLENSEESINNIVEAFGASILEKPPKPNVGAVEAIAALAAKYKLAIVSDTGFSPGVVLRKLLDRYDLTKYFSAFSFSDETGVSKPQAKAFLTALDFIGGKPEESVHIGDIEATDIAGAKSLNMRAIRFEGDETDMVAMRNTKETRADFRASAWEEIPGIIEKLNDK